MLTKLEIRNFKRFDEVAIDLGHAVVFVGPNNTGKTTALQALTLWETGLLAWVSENGTEHRPHGTSHEKSGPQFEAAPRKPLFTPKSQKTVP